MSNTSGANVVSQMLEFYGLREHPFGVSPDPRFLYPSLQHREAMASLIFGIESQVGFAALIAEPGSGKTTLLFDLLARYRDRAHTAFVFNTQCNSLELLRQVVLELEVPGTEQETDPVRLHHLFIAFVASHMNAKPVVIIIDEAQNLENSALETLRLLSNFEAADRKLLHIILAGQPQLADKLRHPSLTQLLQRITMVSQLQRFNRDQIAECIAFRLRVAGHKGGELFSEQAMALLTSASGGVPREINRICMNAMQLGFALKEKTIGVAVIEEVLSDLTLAKWAPRPEAHLSDPGPNRSHTPAGGFRVGGVSGPRPVSPPDDPWATRIHDYARSRPLHGPNDDVDPLLYLRDQPNLRYAQPLAENTGPPVPTDDVDPLRPVNDGGVRRALLDAAVRRRRAAELRLMGLQREEGAAPAASSAVYPYKFAMGCMPNPTHSEATASPDDGERFRGPSGLVAEAEARLEAARQEEREKREKKEKKTGS